MKTTCGRMHGILFFRTSTASSWTSGYCAINVGTGSLIYQSRGEQVAKTRTLIADLRGCSVRTQYDDQVQTTFLNVSAALSTTSLQLRPPVPETFDSWLAALLCWQPMRPKGVQNKMRKPQAIPMMDRRINDRKRTSNVATQRKASIIKVGRMLMWEGPITSAPITNASEGRASSAKSSKLLSSSWKRVSCTLHDNGHFKLLTETDAKPIISIQLSQLSRCAIQRLDASVLDDESCIAIYPQYASHGTAEAQAKPLFFALESTVLYETWFVLLRAFTVPELYGPEHSSRSSQSGRNSGASSNLTPGMFRVERSFCIRVTEAKLRSPTVRQTLTSRKSPRRDERVSESLNGEFYAEVLLDNEIRSRTAGKPHTSSAFWREEFEFSDLPAVLSSSLVVIKVQNTAEKEWTMVAHGPYEISAGSHPLVVDGEIEVSAHDTIIGRVDLQLDNLKHGTEIDQWWPIINDEDQQVGEALMKLRLTETVVLMKDDYAPLAQLLGSLSNGVTIRIAQSLSTELRPLSEVLLDIYQVSSRAGEWISSLIEDEIDGVHKDVPISRSRYSSRMQSQDSYEVSEHRELLVRDLGRSATVEANLLFRGNTLLTKAFDYHMRRLGKDYLDETIGDRVRNIDESDPDCEVDPNKVKSPHDLERNWRNLIAVTSHIWKAIAASANRCPPELRSLFRHVRSYADEKYGAFLRSVPYSSVSGFLFLRFFCPAILNPKLFGLLKGLSIPSKKLNVS